MSFSVWLDTFLSEKGVSPDHILTVPGKEWGDNMIPVAALVEMIKAAPTHEQTAIRDTLIKIDFVKPGPEPVIDYLGHLGKTVAI